MEKGMNRSPSGVSFARSKRRDNNAYLLGVPGPN